MVKKSENKSQALFFIILTATLFSFALAPVTGGFEIGGTKGFLYTILAGLSEGGYFICMARAFEKAPLGIAYSIMRGGAMIVVWAISSTFLGEPLTTFSLVGALLIGFGLYLIQPKTGMTKDLKSGIIWAFAGAVFIAGYHLAYGMSLESGASQVSLFALSMFVSLPILILQAKGKSVFQVPAGGWKGWAWLMLAGVISATSFILFLFGLPMTGPGVAITLRNTSVGWAQVFAFALGERMTTRQVVAVGLILAGAILLGNQ